MTESSAAVVLLRHGETDDNLPPLRFQGRSDTPLNEAGRRQAHEVAGRLDGERFRSLWSSDLSRARATAEILAVPLGLEVGVDARLSESDRGRWEGRLMDDVAAEEPEPYAAWRATDPAFRFPEGESLEEHRGRARAAVADMLCGPLPALAVCHGGTMRCLVLDDLAEFQTLAVPNCSAIELDDAGRPLDARPARLAP